MANYGGLSYGNEVYCGEDIITVLALNEDYGTVTGKTCFQVYNGGGGGSQTVTVNGNAVDVGAGTLDIIIDTITWSGFPGAPPEGICIICSCHDCNDPDGNAAKATYLGEIINPESPFTLIGMGYRQS
jgi:hypothetical protein